MNARARAAILAVALVTATAPARALVPTPWVPANAGVLWYQPGDPSYPLTPPNQPPGEGAWWLTRRIGSSPLRPGLMHLGSFFHGMYVSAGGGAWTTLTPGCWLPVNAPSVVPPSLVPAYDYARRAAIAATGLDACGIEGIAYDPILPARIYVAAYDVVKLTGVDPTLGDGGVYVSDDYGLGWRKLIGGFRGNGLAVARGGVLATIVAGYIQATNSSVGSTPGGGSLTISRDEGLTWSTVALPPSGCTDSPTFSQRITPTIVFNPADASRIYVGTNAGLYASTNGGRTFSAARIACGGVWGIAVSPDGATIYIGDKDGVVSRASSSTLAFSPVADLGAGKIQSLVLDPLDSRMLYAALWSGSDANVFRLRTDGGGVARLDDSLLHDLLPVDQAWPRGIPKPFPLTFKDSKGLAAPSLFLSAPAALYVSTIFRGVFVRGG